jgi:hypothetical protein
VVTAPARLPSFLIIGAQKSGTTTLLDALGHHPGVFAPPDELHFFSHRWDRGLPWYEAQFSPTQADDRVIGEKSPSYLSHPDAPGRIAGTLPAARLVVLLRDPVQRAYSHYWHNRRLDKEPLSFADAVAAEDGRVTDPHTAALYGYVGSGLYVEQLRRYVPHFAPHQLLVELFDDLRIDPGSVLGRVCEFIEVDDPTTPLTAAGVSNAYVEYRSHRVRRATRALPRPLRAAVFRLNTRRATYEPMAPAIRAQLAERFSEPDAELAQWVGRELPWRTG